jgi:hypothetical protein
MNCRGARGGYGGERNGASCAANEPPTPSSSKRRDTEIKARADQQLGWLLMPEIR